MLWEPSTVKSPILAHIITTPFGDHPHNTNSSCEDAQKLPELQGAREARLFVAFFRKAVKGACV